LVAGTQLLGTGHARDIPGNTLAPGSYVLRVVGTDGIDSTEATKNIEVSADPTNLPPVIGAISPPNNTDLGYADINMSDGWYKAVTLSVTATDPDGPALPNSAFTWTTKYTEPNTGTTKTVTLGSGKSLNTHLIGLCAVVDHLVTVTVTDGVNSVSKSVVLRVQLLC